MCSGSWHADLWGNYLGWHLSRDVETREKEAGVAEGKAFQGGRSAGMAGKPGGWRPGQSREVGGTEARGIESSQIKECLINEKSPTF